MNISTLKFQIHLPKPNSAPNHPLLLLTNSSTFHRKQSINFSRTPAKIPEQTLGYPSKESLAENPSLISVQEPQKEESLEDSANGYMVFGGFAVAVVMGMMMMMGDEKALALGPEGPLVEEFWDNVRRYALYALTVSTGAVYTIAKPIFELLKNPISAILILAIMGGSLYLVSQILSAMVGVTDFSYDYAQ